MDRRSFLRSTASAGAGLAWSPSTLAQTRADRKENINVALLGAGAQGEVLLSACMKMGRDVGLRFTAVCDIWEDLSLKRVVGLLDRYGHEASGYVDYRDMLRQEKDLDAVLIATPDFCHAEQTVASLKAGLHVYCEAPMSNTIEGAANMVRAARETGRLLQIGQQRRSNPRYAHCQDKLVKAAGLLGRVVAAGARWNRPARADRGWSKRRELEPSVLAQYGYESMHQFKNWMWYRRLGAGPVVDFGVHQLDVIGWFLGTPPTSITARGGTYYYDKETHEWYDTVMAILEYETAKGMITASYESVSSSGYGGHVEVFMGDEGALELSASPGRGGVYRDPAAPDWDRWVRLGLLQRPGMDKQEQERSEVITVGQTRPPLKYDIPVAVEAPYHQPHLENFFSAIKGRGRLNCPADTAFAATVAALKINEAVEKQATIELTPQDLTV